MHTRRLDVSNRTEPHRARSRRTSVGARGLALVLICAVAGFRTAAAAGAPAVAAAPAASANPVMAAVVNLVVLAENGEQLKTLCARLHSNLETVREAVRAHEAAVPGDDAAAEAKEAWQKKRDDLANALGVALAARDRFSHDTLPAFQRKVNEAKTELDVARTKARATVVDNKRSADAITRINLALVAILKLQTPPPARAGPSALPTTAKPMNC